jgi:hypothetical protein
MTKSNVKIKGRKHYNNSVFDTEQVYASHKASDFIWKVPNLNPGHYLVQSQLLGYLSVRQERQLRAGPSINIPALGK